MSAVMTLLHITNEADFKVRPIEIVGCEFNKPFGGIWCSPVDSPSSWKQWLENTGAFAISDHSVEIDINTDNVLVIDSVDDMEALPLLTGREDAFFSPFRLFDFEALKARGVDAIHLTARGQIVTRHTRPMTFYGWDCETVLILNERCITRVEALKSIEVRK
jgi:hypothetical protein